MRHRAHVVRFPEAVAVAVALGAALACAACDPMVATSDGGAAPGNCDPGSGTVNFVECVQPLLEQEDCAACHNDGIPSIPMPLQALPMTPVDLAWNYDQITARSSAGADSLLILYLWDNPTRNPDYPAHPTLFSTLDEPIAQMLLAWIEAPVMTVGALPPPKPSCGDGDAIDCVLLSCDPADPSTLTFASCVEPVLNYYGPVGTGVGCMSCHSAQVNRPDVRNFHIIPNPLQPGEPVSDTLTDINFGELINYINDNPANARRLDLVVNAANPENNVFLSNPFHQLYNNCLYGPTGSIAVTYNAANGLPAGTHPNTAFACDYANDSVGWTEARALAEIWYYWVQNGAVVR